MTVSLGPYHRGKESFKAMEDCKLFYMDRILSQTAKRRSQGNAEANGGGGGEGEHGVATSAHINLDSSRTTGAQRAILDECVVAIAKMEIEIRQCYSDPIDLNSEEFVEMMVVDGLFIIEYFTKEIRTDARTHAFPNDDPLYLKVWLRCSMHWDFFLLENQLPFFVLKELFKITAGAETATESDLEGEALCTLVLHFLKKRFTEYPHDVPVNQCRDAKHLQDLFTKVLQPRSYNTQIEMVEYNPVSPWELVKELRASPNRSAQEPVIIKSATELARAGVSFKKHSSQSLLDIKFVDGVFEIPPIVIQDVTHRWLRNLIASEQFGYRRSTYMTSYAHLMDSLINSPQDVKLLSDKGIIRNNIGNHEEVSDMFNKLCTDTVLLAHDYNQLYGDVSKYYHKRQHRWKADLKRKYFNSPWTIVSVIAAALIILLTIASTIFTILSYVHSKP